jgi:hypothetical protein
MNESINRDTYAIFCHRICLGFWSYLIAMRLTLTQLFTLYTRTTTIAADPSFSRNEPT